MIHVPIIVEQSEGQLVTFQYLSVRHVDNDVGRPEIGTYEATLENLTTGQSFSTRFTLDRFYHGQHDNGQRSPANLAWVALDRLAAAESFGSITWPDPTEEQSDDALEETGD
jgi:hypothetical protein